MARRPTSTVGFDALTIEGGLIAPEMLNRIGSVKAGEQAEADYGLDPGVKIRDEIGFAFSFAETLWARYRQGGNVERFVEDLLRQVFGFRSLARIATPEAEGKIWPIQRAALGDRVPVVIAPPPEENARRSGLDESLAAFGDGNRRRSATLLVQEFLNASDGAMWGIATDGLSLRILRDNASLTRPAWIEADLARILGERMFADFSVLWLLLHESRFGKAGATAADCPLERWREAGRAEGVKARERLSVSVEAALVHLGNGFLKHADNSALREAITSGALNRQAYFQELLRLVYRFIFLFTAEDRNLLHPPGAKEDTRRLYAEGYSLGRLRERAVRRTAYDRHHDLFEGVKLVTRKLAAGEPKLALPALGALFLPGTTPHLDQARLANRDLLAALYRLAWLRVDGRLERVNWRDMETEELGSVYESLLELAPQVADSATTFRFAKGAEGKGNARKTSGSYYTPDSLVQLLLDSALDPVIEAAIKANTGKEIEALLDLDVIDPACGSGHFLLAAARRIASRIAQFQSPGAPSAEDYRHALREVARHCLYGVDRNPMAVELCKVALWIETVEPGKPLSFLDGRIRQGDSLIGVFDVEMLGDGIPDEAYKALTGDNKDVAKHFAARNRKERKDRPSLPFAGSLTKLASQSRSIDDMAEDDLADIHKKAEAEAALRNTPESWLLKVACDLFVAAFFAPKTGHVPDNPHTVTIPTTDHLWRKLAGHQIHGPLEASAIDIAGRVSAFHWPLAFPEVFAKGGFDCVIGNPPWERMKLQEQEFFASRNPEIAQAANKAARERLIAALVVEGASEGDRRLHADFQFAKREADAGSLFARTSGRYPLTGTGDINTYALFAEHFTRLTASGSRDAEQPRPAYRSLAAMIADSGGKRTSPADRKPIGRAGVIIPTGIATDATTSTFFGSLVDQHRLVSITSFFEIRRWFPATDDRKPFCILVIGENPSSARFAFDVQAIANLTDARKVFEIRPEELAALNPNTKNAPTFRSRADATLTAKIYRQVPVLIDEAKSEAGNPWGITFGTLFHMANDSGCFRNAEQLASMGGVREGREWRTSTAEISQAALADRWMPLYEAKMVHHYDHRWATYDEGAVGDDDSRQPLPEEKANPGFEVSPRYWVNTREVLAKIADVPKALAKAYIQDDNRPLLAALANWVEHGRGDAVERETFHESLKALIDLAGEHFALLPLAPEEWRDTRAKASCADVPPLTKAELSALREAHSLWDAVDALMDGRSPRWLMGWRDICRSTDERTTICGAIPRSAVGHKFLLCFSSQPARLRAALMATMSSLVFDYIARQKLGGTSFTYFTMRQIACPPPSAFTEADLDFIVPRVLELAYTSHSMKPFAEDLGYDGPPFAWEEGRRAQLHADLNVKIAHRYGLNRNELNFILYPPDVMEAGYPTETFRVLKENEERRFNGDFRTRRLVLEAWDRMEAERSLQHAEPPVLPTWAELADGAWARPMTDARLETGVMLAALLKAMDQPRAPRLVRLALVLSLNPSRMLPRLPADDADHWRRLVGAEVESQGSSVANFVPRADAAWGAAVDTLRVSGALIEDLKAGTWAPGTALNQIKTRDWPDGRARMVWKHLPQSEIQVAIDTLPDAYREWVVGAVA